MTKWRISPILILLVSLIISVSAVSAANGVDILVDIKPNTLPNSINPKSRGVIPVAILTTGTFDAATVDPNTVRFGVTGIEADPVHFALDDVDGDGDIDLILHFNNQAAGIVCGDTSASITGETFAGQEIHGTDSIKTVGCPAGEPTDGSISGTVSEQGTGTPIEGLEVSACEFVNFDPCFSGFTDADGNYLIEGVPPDDYILQSGGQDGWVIELFDNTPDFGSAVPVTVVAGEEALEIDFTLILGGSISGTVFEEGTVTGIAGLEVSACEFDPDFPCFSGFTEADGSYTICCIPPADYRLASGGQDNWAVESYNEQPEYFSGERVTVVASVDLVGFDFTLEMDP